MSHAHRRHLAARHDTKSHSRSAGCCPITGLQVAPSTYYAHAARRADPSRASARQRCDAALCVEIRRVWEENFQVYGVRKVWRQLKREMIEVARCTVTRLMRQMGLHGAVRGKPARTTISDRSTPCPADRVNRQFRAARPDALWVSDFTYVATWSGTVYVAFVFDVFSRRIVGWRTATTMTTDIVLDAIEQAIWIRQRAGVTDFSGLVHHADRGSQYGAIAFGERLAAG